MWFIWNTPALVLCLNFVPEKVGMKRHKSKMLFPSETRGLIENSQPKGIKLKMTEHKLESGVNWQEVSKQKGT